MDEVSRRPNTREKLFPPRAGAQCPTTNVVRECALGARGSGGAARALDRPAGAPLDATTFVVAPRPFSPRMQIAQI